MELNIKLKNTKRKKLNDPFSALTLYIRYDKLTKTEADIANACEQKI